MDFKVPSRKQLVKLRTTMYNRIVDKVRTLLAEMKAVFICVDGWSDHQHSETLGVMMIDPSRSMKPIVLDIEQQSVCQTADNLAVYLKTVLKFITDCGCRAICCVSDNAANITAALSTIAADDNCIPQNCLAHSGV